MKWRENKDNPEGLHPDSLKNIMKYLFGFVEKEQHVESLVGKLCLRYFLRLLFYPVDSFLDFFVDMFFKPIRFKETSDRFLWRHIVHCMTLLNFGEKSIKKLTESFRFYKDCLIDDVVYEHFLAVTEKVHSIRILFSLFQLFIFFRSKRL